MALIFSMCACLGGIGLSWWCYMTASGERARKAARAAISPIYNAAQRKFFMDDIAETLVIGPTKFLGALLAWADGDVVDGVVDGIGAAAKTTGDVSGRADDVAIATAGITVFAPSPVKPLSRPFTSKVGRAQTRSSTRVTPARRPAWRAKVLAVFLLVERQLLPRRAFLLRQRPDVVVEARES